MPVHKPREKNIFQRYLKEIVSTKTSRRSYARLIQKIYVVDPLVCPKCGSEMSGIAVITDPSGCKHPLDVKRIVECVKCTHTSPFDKGVPEAS